MKLNGSTLFNIALCLALTACSVSMDAVASEPTSLPAVVPTILPTASSITHLSDRMLATLNIPNEPDELVFVEGYIWTRSANGHVLQIDPATNSVVGDIQVDTTTDMSHYCQGMSTDGENIWTCSASGGEDSRSVDMVRIDPQSKSVVATVKVPKIFDQFEFPFLHNQVWVLTGNGDKLVGIDADTNQPGPVIDLGVRCSQLAATDRMLLATCTLDNLILQIDPVKREVTARVSVQGPRLIAASANAVWVAQDNALLRLDPRSLDPVVTVTGLHGVGLTGDIYITDNAVWVREQAGFLYRIDPTTNAFMEQIQLEEPLRGGSVVATSDSVWATAGEDNLLFRLSLEDSNK